MDSYVQLLIRVSRERAGGDFVTSYCCIGAWPGDAGAVVFRILSQPWNVSLCWLPCAAEGLKA